MKKLLFIFLTILFTFSLSAQTTSEDYFNIGFKNTENNNYNAAISAYDKALRLESSNVLKSYIYYNRGYTKFLMGNKSGACNDISNAKRLGYDYARKVYNEICN